MFSRCAYGLPQKQPYRRIRCPSHCPFLPLRLHVTACYLRLRRDTSLECQLFCLLNDSHPHTHWAISWSQLRPLSSAQRHLRARDETQWQIRTFSCCANHLIVSLISGNLRQAADLLTMTGQPAHFSFALALAWLLASEPGLACRETGVLGFHSI